MPVMLGKVLNGGVMNAVTSGGTPTPPTSPVLQNFLPTNTINFKKMINDVKAGTGSRHAACCGNSTKHGTGANGTAFGVPTGISAASRLRSSIYLWAPLLAALYGITVSIDNFWGDGGWGLPVTNVTVVDPRITTVATPTISSSQMGPGGNALATTNTTTGWVFTPTSGRQFDSFTVFYVDTGGAISLTGDVDLTPHVIATQVSGNVYMAKVTFSGLQNSVTFKATTASGLRLQGGFCETNGLVMLHVHNMGWVGSTTALWASTTAQKDPATYINLLAPSIVLFGEDINDPYAAVTPAAHQTNIQNFFASVINANTDGVLWTDHYPASSDVDGASGAPTLAALQASFAASMAAGTALNIPQALTQLRYGSYFNQHTTLNYMWDTKHMLSNLAGPTVGYVDQATNILMPMTAAALAA